MTSSLGDSLCAPSFSPPIANVPHRTPISPLSLTSRTRHTPSDDESSTLASISSTSVLFDPAQVNAHRAQLASLKPRGAVMETERAAASFRATTHTEYVRELEKNVAVCFPKDPAPSPAT
ncbi:hypothetical protein M427DRAFT_269242 [Gonapodya prolifera JEL478]|uniref:Uncharacterized protein n=1 Tax=Gonapodya prolifera (strain JEL478) TaxID=1344416 RepID=A0A139AJQ7_GONPJ|nr:hypothetical protein M427DRAFT_269242 [Gonapodya prolifera JEL478]|eukprot:KXS17040.1 hypothetical protein M427DRAFT_269242 [Gonapodya prolifera JEL478]